jgi:hypothetical protein
MRKKKRSTYNVKILTDALKPPYPCRLLVQLNFTRQKNTKLKLSNVFHKRVAHFTNSSIASQLYVQCLHTTLLYYYHVKQISSLQSNQPTPAKSRAIDALLQPLTFVNLRYATGALGGLLDAIASPTRDSRRVRR